MPSFSNYTISNKYFIEDLYFRWLSQSESEPEYESNSERLRLLNPLRIASLWVVVTPVKQIRQRPIGFGFLPLEDLGIHNPSPPESIVPAWIILFVIVRLPSWAIELRRLGIVTLFLSLWWMPAYGRANDTSIVVEESDTNILRSSSAVFGQQVIVTVCSFLRMT